MSSPSLIATILRPEGATGVQSHFRAFLTWAQGKGYPVNLVTPYSGPRWQVYPVFAIRRLIDPLHKTASVWWYRYWHALFLERALRHALSDGHPITIYAQCPLSASAALRARSNKAQKVVMVVHFNISQADEWVSKGMITEGSPLYRAIREFETDVLSCVDGLVFVSDFMRKEISVRIPATKSIPYRIVPNFIADPHQVTKTVEFQADLICVGTLEPRKNQRYALEIVAAAARLGRPLSLTLVGDGPDRKMLESFALECGVRQYLTFTGYVQNAAGFMQLHRACLHVANMESFGIVLIEAMANGIPVFAPAVGGIPEVFVDQRQGCFIPFDDANACARLIIDWLDSEKKMESARLAARKHFLAHFEASKVAADLADFLAHLDDEESRIVERNLKGNTHDSA